MPRSPRKNHLVIDGPVGPLEALLELPAQATTRSETEGVTQSGSDSTVGTVAVLCHPHPQHGGTMLNKVVHTLARAMLHCGHAALRFNYRGVGASGGSYAGGEGELEDALAVIAYVRQRWPHARLRLAGFSFGGVVAARAAVMQPPERLITVAPAVNILDMKLQALPTMPWLIVQGEADDVVPAAAVQSWVSEHLSHGGQSGPELLLLPGVGHFFHGELGTLRDAVAGWAG